MNEEEIQFVFSPPTKLFENSESKTLERRLFQFIKEETPVATVPAQVVIKDGLDYGVMFDNIEQSLECPVCYKVPREVPIPCCVSGHIICKSCRSKVNECPTCRGWYYQNTSSIMASLIEQIPHRCKYVDLQCDVKMKLCDITEHEKICPERLVKCPSCSEEVQLRKFHSHKCVKEQGPSNIYLFPYFHKLECPLSDGFLEWDGKSGTKGDEFDLSENIKKMICFPNDGKRFYFSFNYFASKKMFVFFVMMVEDFESAGEYSVKMTISSDDSSRKISYECPVRSIDNIPSLMVFPSDACFEFCCVPYESMRCLFKITRTWHNQKWQVGFTTEVEIKKRK